MRRLLICWLMLPMAAGAQQLHFTAWGGFAGYQGDLQSKQITLNQSNLAFGFGLKYDFTPHLALRLGFSHGKIEASDSKNDAELKARNLSFESKITEGSLLVEYAFLDLSSRNFTPYVFGGLGVYHYNPYAFDTLGNKIYLRPLSTEGQGLSQYPDRKMYNLTQLSLPFGGGVRLRVSDGVTLGYEMGFRKLFTDYLDDLSTTYVDAVILLQERGATAVEMAYRGGELKDGDPIYPGEGATRGGSKFKDWYYFHGITLTVALGNGGPRKNKNGRIDCPEKVY